MRKQLMQAINDDLHNMELTGKVSLDILEKLDKLREFLNQLKTKWLEDRSSDSYYFYQGLRNVELMLDRMQYRFEHAPELHDNPKIAADSQILFNVVDGLLKVTESNNVNDETVNDILHKTRILRETASKQDLLESQIANEELIDKDGIRLQFSGIMRNLDIPQELDQYTIGDEETKSNS